MVASLHFSIFTATGEITSWTPVSSLDMAQFSRSSTNKWAPKNFLIMALFDNGVKSLASSSDLFREFPPVWLFTHFTWLPLWAIHSVRTHGRGTKRKRTLAYKGEGIDTLEHVRKIIKLISVVQVSRNIFICKNNSSHPPTKVAQEIFFLILS